MSKRSREDVVRNVIVVSVLIVFLSVAALLIQNPIITGSSTIQTISLIKEGQQLELEVLNVKNVNQAVINVVKETKNSKVLIEETAVPASFKGKAISAFKVYSDQNENFGKVKFTLKIKNSDLEGIPPTEIKLYLENAELPIEAGKKEQGYQYFTAVSSRLGTFVIGKQQAEPVKAETVVMEPAPAVQQPAPPRGFFNRIYTFFKRFIGN